MIFYVDIKSLPISRQPQLRPTNLHRRLHIATEIAKAAHKGVSASEKDRNGTAVPKQIGERSEHE